MLDSSAEVGAFSNKNFFEHLNQGKCETTVSAASDTSLNVMEKEVSHLPSMGSQMNLLHNMFLNQK